MPGNPRRQITAQAEERFPLRIVIRTPPGGFGARYDMMMEWLDEHSGIDGWTIGPAGTRGVHNDAIAVYVGNPTCAPAFIARSAGASPVIPLACTSFGRWNRGGECRRRITERQVSDAASASFWKVGLSVCFAPMSGPTFNAEVRSAQRRKRTHRAGSAGRLVLSDQALSKCWIEA